jgi:hypothetical protein
MNRYLIVSRLRWPALLLLTGVIALLDEMDILSWGHAWPLYLILLGVLALAERAALAADPPPSSYPYGAGYPAPGYPAAAYAGGAPAEPVQPVQPASTGIVPANKDLDLQNGASEIERRKSWEEEGR